MLATMAEEIDEIIRLRADLVEATRPPEFGVVLADTPLADTPLADLKAMEARVSEIIDGIAARGVEVKGFAPLLLDFPMEVEGRHVLLCWVEGEPDLSWYHETAHGFAGRRPLNRLLPTEGGASED